MTSNNGGNPLKNRKMKDQKIFRHKFANGLSAIATTDLEEKVWVRYYNGLEEIETISLKDSNYQYHFVINIENEIRDWCEDNGYTLWSY